MQKLKNEKGITIIALTITITVLMMISVPVIVNTPIVTELARYSKFKEDMDNLRESISVAFNNESLSGIGPTYKNSLDFLNLDQNGKKVKNVNDNDIYYAINIDEINKRLPTNMRELNYGVENSAINEGETYSGTSDVYIINDASRTIYYVKGVEYKGNTFYRLPEDFTDIESEIKAGETVTNINKYFTDKEGNTAKVPVGFKVSDKEEEQIVSKGLVISDEQGNEFVWIPVNSLKDEEGDLVEINFDRQTYGNQVEGDKDNVYQSIRISNDEEDNNFFYESDREFETLSVTQNKGFYIARYEAGSDEVRTESSSNDTPVVKKGANVYNYVNRNDAKTLAEDFINTENVSSKLCSSQAWDTALEFIKQTGNDSYLDDSKLGNYDGTLKTTGSTTSVNNIFDLGGNANEWTTELYSDDSSQYTLRGGSIENTSSASPATSRIATEDLKSANTGFRIALFLSANSSNVPLDKIGIGDVVNYTPNTDKNAYSITTPLSGYVMIQDIKRENYTWKVINKNSDGTVEIMGIPTDSMQNLYFKGATGYNNGVYLLNEICNTLYSNKELGVTARSIEINDIESKMNNVGKSARDEFIINDIKYGDTNSTAYEKANSYYPKLAPFENILAIDEDKVKINGIEESQDGADVKEITIPLLKSKSENGILQGNSLTVKQTFYNVEQQSDFYYNNNFYDLAFGTKTNYFLSSRFSKCSSKNATFGLKYIRNNYIDGFEFMSSDSSEYECNAKIAPVVSVGSDIKWSQEDNGSWTLSK